jgi:RNA methyltransferase, TrmH family
MARCLLAENRCGRLGSPCRSGHCVARQIRRLHERRWRDKLELFFVEGEDAVEAATAEPVELLVAGRDVAPELLAEVSSAAHPPRMIGVYRRADLPRPEARPVALELHGVSDPGNVGTLVRTADAFGAAVVLTPGCADPTGPKALRASAGSIWRAPLVLPGDHVSVLTRKHRRVALVAHGGHPLGELELQGPVVFLLGAERSGLPAEVGYDLSATIAVASESLNVAAAGAIALYDWHRQNP